MIKVGSAASSLKLIQLGERLSLDFFIRGLLLIYIAVLPFKNLLVIERNGFLVLLGLLAIWCVANRRLFYRPIPFELPLAAFVGWVGITIPFATFPDYSLKEFGKLLQQVIVLYATVYFFSHRSFRVTLFVLMGCLLLVVSMKGLSQFDLDYPQAVVSFFPAEVWLTTFLVLVIPLSIATGFLARPLWLRSAGFVTLVMSGVCLISTQSRAGLVSFMAGFWATACLVRTRSALILAGMVSLGLVVGFLLTVGMRVGAVPLENGGNHVRAPFQTSVHSIIHRFDIWAFSLDEIGKHWLIGIGYGKDNFLNVYGHEQEMNVATGHSPVKTAGTHNIFLYYALHVGIPGMLIFCWLYGSILLRTIQESQASEQWLDRIILSGIGGGLVGFATRLQFDQMFVGSLAVFFWVLVGFAVLSYPSRRSDCEST
ncbi:MAG TPA: O-antigen ligase family protein [Nitrospira sp.]|nr:O-antigen ligase family protein [Nitrospira sp.]